jgi:hypothetical protein
MITYGKTREIWPLLVTGGAGICWSVAQALLPVKRRLKSLCHRAPSHRPSPAVGRRNQGRGVARHDHLWKNPRDLSIFGDRWPRHLLVGGADTSACEAQTEESVPPCPSPCPLPRRGEGTRRRANEGGLRDMISFEYFP